MTTLPISFAAEELHLDTRRALWWPRTQTLVVSDLHLGKADAFAPFATLLPPYDCADTLKRLEALVAHYLPRRVLCLGDSFHRVHSFGCLSKNEQQHLVMLAQSVPEWLWVEGNHDPSIPPELPGTALAHWVESGLCFTHEPEASLAQYAQIVGHFHPKFTRQVQRTRISKPCFTWNDRLFIMPAFGTLTGGLDVYGNVLRPVLGKKFHLATADTIPKPVLFEPA